MKVRTTGLLARNLQNVRVVVTGGRTFTNKRFVYRVLDDLHGLRTLVFLGHGGAQGVDTFAKMWAISRKVSNDVWEAKWDEYREAAGNIRNGVMLREAKPDIVVAFPGNTGTADCVEQAKRIGIALIEVSP